MAADPTVAELRKLAAQLREQGDEADRANMIKAGHVLTAAKGLEVLREKLRGWYELVS